MNEIEKLKQDTVRLAAQNVSLTFEHDLRMMVERRNIELINDNQQYSTMLKQAHDMLFYYKEKLGGYFLDEHQKTLDTNINRVADIQLRPTKSRMGKAGPGIT